MTGLQAIFCKHGAIVQQDLFLGGLRIKFKDQSFELVDGKVTGDLQGDAADLLSRISGKTKGEAEKIFAEQYKLKASAKIINSQKPDPPAKMTGKHIKPKAESRTAIAMPVQLDAEIETPGSQYWKSIEAHILTKTGNIDFNNYDLTEDAAGRLFVDITSKYFRSNTTINGFMVWTGTHWAADRWKLAERAAAIIGEIYQAQLATISTASIKEAATFIKKIRSSYGIRSILFFASSDPRITTTQEDYDANPHLLNTPGGTVELETGILRDHKRADLITKITKYTPDKNHAPKYFQEFLDKITLGRKDLQEALQRILGSGCSGKYPKDEIGEAHGGGSNGKTVLAEACGDTLGDYAATLNIKSLCIGEKEAAGHTDDIASLHGIRYCLSSESNQTVKLDEAKIKKYSGGDRIPVSFKHGRTFQMRPCFTLIILTNHRFKITGRDTGIWRRIILFPFDYRIPDEEKDLDFKVKMLQADGPYIAWWLIDGCRKWYAEGYGSFKTTKEATAKYRAEEDIVGRFLSEECVLEKRAETKALLLSETFKRWCTENDERYFSGRAWGDALIEHGLSRRHTMNGKIWEGVRFRNPNDELTPEEEHDVQGTIEDLM